MLRLTPDRRFALFLLISIFAASTLAACDQTQSVSLTAEDFRFTPQLVKVSSASPLTLTIYNSGREMHEFDSPVLMYVVGTSSPLSMKETGIVLGPGKSVQLVMTPPPATYIYICRRKGHVNMAGTLIVE
ncbi:cupredoxin domain-containing protein [Nitrospira sp. BLG_2]|uniref:cupredoxin domain-containing protein n=1 Tax=Nitrospira sp. BLG_2 TaxID=3397507 RepID=UPI003B9D0D08